jgi:branched-chain amino acid transport system ATP-binding protein
MNDRMNDRVNDRVNERTKGQETISSDADPVRAAPALSARDVHVSYGGVAAVAGLSLDARAGEAVGLIGPNGAGKSSFLAALGGQVKIQRGSISVAGTDVSRLPAYRRARRGVVRTFQMTSEFAGMTTFENLLTAGQGAEGAALKSVVVHPGRTRQRERAVAGQAWQLLDRFEMTKIANAYGRELSGGQRRLVEIMRCLMREPTVLLLDEPMVGVTPHVADKLIADLKSIRDEGIALILVEHALEVVSELCDRVVVMALGRSIASGTYDEVVRSKEVQAAYLG